MARNATSRLALLIDADNAKPLMANSVIAEIAKYGTIFVKRAYGDWTVPNLAGWKKHLLENSIQPIQQFSYTNGKNATDAAMIIDAMDLLYSNRFDGFCIVSSDSDFTRLASRIRESGLVVYGCGERKTPQPFVTACDKFIHVENLVPDKEVVLTAASTSPESKPSPATMAAPLPGDKYSMAISWLREATDELSNAQGWSALDIVGQLVTKRHPEFDSRTFGYKRLSQLLESTSLFDIKKGVLDSGRGAAVYVREKQPSEDVPT